MALESGILGGGGDRQSQDRETPAPSSLPELGTAAAVALGRALTVNVTETGRGRHHAVLSRLRALTELRRVLEDLERVHVDQAMRVGNRWEDVGEALGTSRSAVHRKHGGRRPRWSP